MSTEQQRVKEHLDELLELEDGLTPWEVDFIDSVSKWEDDLTPKQMARIYKIYDRRC